MLWVMIINNVFSFSICYSTERSELAFKHRSECRRTIYVTCCGVYTFPPSYASKLLFMEFWRLLKWNATTHHLIALFWSVLKFSVIIIPLKCRRAHKPLCVCVFAGLLVPSESLFLLSSLPFANSQPIRLWFGRLTSYDFIPSFSVAVLLPSSFFLYLHF